MAIASAPAPAPAGPRAYPWLVFVHGENHENQSFCDAVSRAETSFTRTIPESINTPILKATNHPDWLVLHAVASAGSPVQLRLWNPVSLRSIHLPSLELESVESIRHVSLSNNPIEPECVLFLWVNDEILFCYVNGGDDRIWTRGENEKINDDFDHCVLMSDIKVVDQNRLDMKPLKCKAPYNHVLGTHPIEYNSHWVSCCGDIFVIYVSFGGVGHKEKGIGEEIVSFTVFKVDSSANSWNIVDSCPNASFFVSGDQVLACPIASADSSKFGNRVYMVLEGSKFLCIYHIREKTLQKTLLLPYPSTIPYWILIPDEGALEKAEEDYHTNSEIYEEEKEEDQYFVNDQILRIPYDDDDDDEDDEDIDDDEERTSLNDLPDDILKLISSYLSEPVDYLNFRATSKLCRSVGTAKEWRSISRSNVSTLASPWLMIPSLVDKGVSTMFDPVSGKRYYVRTSWGHDHSRITFSLDGWLLMYSDYLSGENDEVRVKLRLYNPITKATIGYPEREPLPHFFFLPFSAPQDSTVVGISVSGSASTISFTLLSERNTDGESKWYGGLLNMENAEENGGNDHMYVNQSHINPVCFNNRSCFFVGDGDIASVGLGEDGRWFTIRSDHLKLPCSSSFEQRFLVGFGYQILSVYIGKEWEWLRVFVLDRSDMVWDEVGDLKVINIYLSAVSCFVSVAESPELGNRVYLPRFQDGHIVYYSFNTRRFHAGDSLASYHESKEQLYCSWFHPSWNV